MTGIFRIDDPDQVRATMTITMSIANWKALRDHLEASEHKMHTPTYRLRSLIADLIGKAETFFHADGGDVPDEDKTEGGGS